MIRPIVLLLWLATSASYGSSQAPDVEPVHEVLATHRVDGSIWYALVLKNDTQSSVTFEAVPDIAFTHSACMDSKIFPVTVWRQAHGKWKPIKTFISGVEVSKLKPTRVQNLILQPGSSLCAGWWVPSHKKIKSSDLLKISVCTSFNERARCFDSEPFSIKTSQTSGPKPAESRK